MLKKGMIKCGGRGSGEKEAETYQTVYLHYALPAFLMTPLFMKTHHVESTWLGKELSGIRLGTLLDTTSIAGYFYTLIYGSEMKRRTRIEGDQTCSLPKTSNGGIRGWVEAFTACRL